MRVGVFHPGSQNSWQRATAFQETDALGWYATSAYFHPGSAPVRLANHVPGARGERLRQRLLKRWFPPLDARHIRRMGCIEFGELGLRRAGWTGWAHRVNLWGNRRFGQAVIGLLKREPVDVVWGYNSSSLEVFRWAKARGLTCVLDQSIGHPAAENAVLAAEQSRCPALFGESDRRHDAAWIARNDAEIALADRVVVGSQAAADTLTAQGCPAAKIAVVPYGYDETLFPATPPARTPPLERPLSCLFVGTAGPRKGLGYLLPAMAQLPPSQVQLTLVGRLDMPAQALEPYRAKLRHIAQIPRRDVVAHFLNADLFVFPSLFEGGGVALAEALGAGLGIVQGPQSGVGAADGVSGRVLPDLSADALAETLATAARNPEQVSAWQTGAWRAGRTRRWADYRAGLRGVLGL